MRTPRLFVYFASAIIAGIFGLYTNADAYTPSAGKIFDLTVNALGTCERLFVSQKTAYYYESRPDPVIVNETLMYRFPDQFRSEMITGSGQRIHIFSEGKAITLINNKPAYKSSSIFDIFKDILLFRTSKLMSRRLKAVGIDDSTVSLGRFEGKSAFVIGARFPDMSCSQIWIEKNGSLPYRLILSGDTAGVGRDRPVEFRYLDWRSVKGVQYPFKLEIYENEILVTSANVEKAVANPSFPAELFDIPAIKEKAAPSSPDLREPSEDSIPEGLDEVRKTIEDFRKRYEFDHSDEHSEENESIE